MRLSASPLHHASPPDARVDLKKQQNAWTFRLAIKRNLSGKGMDSDQAQRLSWRSYVRVLLACNEFITVD